MSRKKWMGKVAGKRSIEVKDRVRPKKRLGQHFLKDPTAIRKIIELADLDETGPLLEIGPGLGALTFPLASRVQHLFAVEKDMSLIEVLDERLSRAGIHNVTLIHGDILKLDLDRIFPCPPKGLNIIGNLPYNISSPVLEKLFQNKAIINRAVLMFQAELARRLTASPGNRDYGALSIITRYHARPSPLIEISKEAFHPRPKVDSIVIELDFKRPHPRRAENEKYFFLVVKGAFAHRRKTILNSLKLSFAFHSQEAITGALEACAIGPHQRAESLDIDDFLRLTAVFASLS